MKKIFCIYIIFIMFLTVACGEKNININYGGGDNSNLEIDENTEFDDIIASKPTKDGYVFAGWYSDANFTDYINPNGITDTQRKKGTAYAKWIVVKDSETYNVRQDVVTITDSGRKKQKMDQVYISNDYNITDLKRAGYTKFIVNVLLDVTEVDDGYQYVFIYSDENCTGSNVSSVMDFYDKYVFGNEKEDPSLLYMHKFEHGAGKEDKSWNTINFEVTFDIGYIYKDLFIRYGASGKNDDDWKNKNLIVTVTPIK